MNARSLTLAASLALLLGCAGTAPTPSQQVASPAFAAARTAQLARLQALLRDPAFSREMAEYLDASYYRGLGQPVPAFLKPEEETQTAAKSTKEEKIATNVAGFYAVEVGVGYLAARDRQTPVQILESVANGTRSNADMLLLARFANATWKAGQPFRAMNRITRDTFRPAALLTDDELKKDFDQVRAASAALAVKMQEVKTRDTAAQLDKLQTLLRDPAFALEMAQALDAAYYRGQGQAVPVFVKPEEEAATSPKSVRDEKIATNLAGFYALEAGVGVLAERGQEAPLEIVDSIAAGRRSAADLALLAAFANATWKAGQPFRGLSRVTRETFKPVGLLNTADVKKDTDQIQAAAVKLAQAMRRP